MIANSVTRAPNYGTSTSVTTWLGDRQGSPSAVGPSPFVVDTPNPGANNLRVLMRGKAATQSIY